jgi:hypothetical protein
MAEEKKKNMMDIFKEMEGATPQKDKKEEAVEKVFARLEKEKMTESKPEKESPPEPEPKKEKLVFPQPTPDEESPVKVVKTTPPPAPFFKKKADETEFDLSPARALVKHVIMVYGNKGEGKTTLGQSFGSSQIALSFDQKTESVREHSKYKEDILVFDGTRYLDKSSPDEWLESSERSWRYINKLLDRIPDVDESKTSTPLVIKQEGAYREYVSGNPDWVMIDAGEVFETVAEMVMRSRNSIQAFEGFANKNLWKERRMYLDQLLRKCTRKASKGVVWTSYVSKDEIVENGEFIAKKDVPKYIDAVLRETDVVIRVERVTGKTGQCFFATVESSKWDKIPESRKIDVTGKGVEALAKGEI